MIRISQEHFEENRFREEDLLQLDVYGVSMAPDPQNPILLLKHMKSGQTLSVRLSPLETGIAVAQSDQTNRPQTPHRLLEELIQSMSLKITRCIFVEIKSGLQYVRVYFDGHPQYGSLKFRADEVMSALLYLKIPFFATPKIIEKSRNLSMDEVQGPGLPFRTNLKEERPHRFIQ